MDPDRALTRSAATSPADVRAALDRLLDSGNGVVRVEPTWVARDFLPPGRRLGLAEHQYAVGDRGFICERWLASTTNADNAVGPDDEGLSYLVGDDGGRLLLRDAVWAAPEVVMGEVYAASHPRGLGRLAKLFDYSHRLPYHIHPPAEFASLVGARPKDESYHYLPGVDMGDHPETFFGVHPWIGREAAFDVLLPYLVDWDSDLILRHARGELQVAGEGFHVPSGVLHAPGTALTLELQEDSDVLSMFQALNAGRIISKDLLFKDVRAVDRQREGERFPLRFVDAARNADPFLYENRHLSPQSIRSDDGGVEEAWIFYNTDKYSGKRLVVPPGASTSVIEPGAYSLFVWSGRGTYAGHEVAGGSPGRDELLVVHDAATRPHEVRSAGSEDLVVFTFFGPDLQESVPTIPPW